MPKGTHLFTFTSFFGLWMSGNNYYARYGAYEGPSQRTAAARRPLAGYPCSICWSLYTTHKSLHVPFPITARGNSSSTSSKQQQTIKWQMRSSLLFPCGLRKIGARWPYSEWAAAAAAPPGLPEGLFFSWLQPLNNFRWRPKESSEVLCHCHRFTESKPFKKFALGICKVWNVSTVIILMRHQHMTTLSLVEAAGDS